jgi:uncharacterized protein
MIVEIKNITEEKTAFDWLIESKSISLDEDSATLDSPVNFTGTYSQIKEKIRVEGRLSVNLSIDCDRCLISTEYFLETPIDAIFIDENFKAVDSERQLADEDLIVSLIENETLDFFEITREQILLALPNQFICSESCKGLCQKCRTNKNINDCDCNQKEIDPRWAGLKNLIN